MAARGRRPGFIMSNEHRNKIKNSNILNALIEHVEGKREMSATQVTAGLGLLKKALPDLQSVEHSGSIGGDKDVSEMTDNELASLTARIRASLGGHDGVDQAPLDPTQLN